jgi:hypothetical protein
MNRTPFFFAASAAAALAFAVPRDAHALGALDVEVGPVAGAGTMPTHQGNAAIIGATAATAPNPLGFGLGGRAGVGFSGVYLGVEGMYSFGTTNNSDYGAFKAHSDLYGVDVGYSFRLPPVTIRPVVGVGNFTESVSGLPLPSGPVGSAVSPNSSNQSYSTLYIQPGITGLVSLGTFYVGADANVLLLTSFPMEPNSAGSEGARDALAIALTVHAQVGLRF